MKITNVYKYVLKKELSDQQYDLRVKMQGQIYLKSVLIIGDHILKKNPFRNCVAPVFRSSCYYKSFKALHRCENVILEYLS